jgi:hypothetical protein
MQDHHLTRYTPPESADAFKDLIGDMFERKAHEIFVIMNSAHTTVLKDPGLDRPWASTNKLRAENIARQVGKDAVVVSLNDAVEYLFKKSSKKFTN